MMDPPSRPTSFKKTFWGLVLDNFQMKGKSSVDTPFKSVYTLTILVK